MNLSFLKQGYLFGPDRMLDGFLRQDDLCCTVMNEIAPRIRLEDFEDMYKEGGRPPISPKVLLLVLILQYIERLSDLTCPEGKKSEKFSVIKGNRIKARFAKADCAACPRNAECQAHPQGKQIQVRLENEILTSRRKLMVTENFRIDMHQRNGIEGTISGLIRGTGKRNSRYRGKNKTPLQIKFSGVAANITRLHRKRQTHLRKVAV
jgi:hypothetical protein